MTYLSNPKLAPIYAFFDKGGSARLHGLDPSYFVGLNDSEKDEAWDFLSQRFALSTDRITGLYYLDPERAVAAFKKEIESPMQTSPYPAERKYIEECRLLMLQCIYLVQPEGRHLDAMTDFARSEFEEVRSLFAKSVPTHKVTRGAVDSLKEIILTETEEIPQGMAIRKFLVIHGMDFDRRNRLYRSLYQDLSADDPKVKLAAMQRVEAMQRPDFITEQN